MSYGGILLVFAVVHLLAAASPGPNRVVVGSYAAAQSRRAGLLAALGIVLATLTWVTMTALGMAAILHQSPALYEVLRYVGAAYLIWLGLRMVGAGLKRVDPCEEGMLPGRGSTAAIVSAGYLVNMTNPKTIAYYTSLFAVLIPADAPTWLFVAAAAVAVAVSASWWSLVAVVFSTGRVRRGFARARRYLDLIMGGALILLGLRLASGR